MKRFLGLLTLGLGLVASSVYAKYPEKPVRLVVPFAPGSLTDVVTRELARAMQENMGQPIVVENKAGASGVIGTQAVANAAPDGYTILIVGVTTAASNVSLFKSLSYDPRKDFTPIGYVAESPFLLVANKDFPASTLSELYALAKKEPESISYAYASGSAQVSGAKLATDGGVTFLNVPYQSSPQILTDIIGGTVDVTFSDFARGMAQVKAGTMKALGVTTKDRFTLAPDIPTLNESGAPGYEIVVWFGLVGPAGLPSDVTKSLSDALKMALANPELISKFNAQGLSPQASTAEEFGKFIDSEIDVWGQMIKDVGIEPR